MTQMSKALNAPWKGGGTTHKKRIGLQLLSISSPSYVLVPWGRGQFTRPGGEGEGEGCVGREGMDKAKKYVGLGCGASSNTTRSGPIYVEIDFKATSCLTTAGCGVVYGTKGEVKGLHHWHLNDIVYGYIHSRI